MACYWKQKKIVTGIAFESFVAWMDEKCISLASLSTPILFLGEKYRQFHQIKASTQDNTTYPDEKPIPNYLIYTVFPVIHCQWFDVLTHTDSPPFSTHIAFHEISFTSQEVKGSERLGPDIWKPNLSSAWWHAWLSLSRNYVRSDTVSVVFGLLRLIHPNSTTYYYYFYFKD